MMMMMRISYKITFLFAFFFANCGTVSAFFAVSHCCCCCCCYCCCCCCCCFCQQCSSPSTLVALSLGSVVQSYLAHLSMFRCCCYCRCCSCCCRCCQRTSILVALSLRSVVQSYRAHRTVTSNSLPLTLPDTLPRVFLKSFCLRSNYKTNRQI